MSCDDSRAIVVGAGIAGLSAAIALDRIGIRAEVLERASALTQAGTALSLWPNAVVALDHLGLGGDVRGIGIEEPAGTASLPSGKPIFRLDQSLLSGRLGAVTQIVHRAELQRLLLERCAHLPVRLHTPVRRISAEGAEGEVHLEDGEVLRAPIVLGCDGLDSVARAVVGNPAPMFRSRTSWRAVLDGCDDLVSAARLTVAPGQQFMASPMKTGLTYWAADMHLPEGQNAKLTDRKTFLLDAFGDWHAPIPDLIGHVRDEQLVIADLYDAIPTRLAAGPVVLLGDAAHPMVPDLGQGACQAIEDAVVLAACLVSGKSREDSFTRYERARLRRVRTMVRASRRIGRLATTASPTVILARDWVSRLMPDELNARLVARYASEDAFRRSLAAATA